MTRYIALIILALALVGCNKKSEASSLPSATFTLPDGPGNLSDDVSGHTTSGLLFAAIQKQRRTQSMYAPFAPLLRSNHKEMSDDQWFKFCFEQLFMQLEFPFSETPGSGVKFSAADYSYTITHSSDALVAYQALLNSKHAPEERYNELINGLKNQEKPKK